MQTQAAAASDTPTPITIRPLHSPAEFRACQEVQRQAWGITEDGYLMPVATLAGASAYGGLVLGAFDGDRLIGFSFAFRGVLASTPILYSQLTGVLPEAQGGGVGRRIKFFQRQWAREHDLPYVAWAFDPLQAMNAYYNLVVLGAVATHYHPDFYGTRQDALNPGLPTDRLLCVWQTADPLPEKPTPKDEEIALIVSSHLADDGGRTVQGIASIRQFLHEPRYVGIEVPRDLQAIRQHGPALLVKWQTAVREVFTEAFAMGFRAVTFRRNVTHASFGQPVQRGVERAMYILTREDER